MISSGNPSPPSVINSFTGEYRFLSNFYLSRIDIKGISYSTVEHAYQAQKTMEIHQQEWIKEALTPGEAKRRGRRTHLRSDWECMKINIMRDLLRLKFEVPDLRKKLADTENAELIEGNTWEDTFWGVCNGVGENNLGKLLMKVRKELR